MTFQTKFRNATNVLYTKDLFFETALNKENVLYTLKNSDHMGYPSLYRLYMEVGDPTEYAFAVQYLEGWEHWDRLCQCSWFTPYVEKWRKELEIKIRSAALARIIKQSEAGGKDGFQANKYITDRGYDKPAQTRGRPKKEDIAKAANQIAAERTQEDEDYLRLVKS